MTTNSVIPAPVPPTVTSDIKSAESKIGVFLTAHHIVLYVLLGLAIGAGIYLFESKAANRAGAKADAAIAALAAEKDHSAQLVALYTASEAAREQDRAQLTAAVARIQTQSKVQIVHDQALPAPQLSQRIDDLTNSKAGTATVDSSQNVVVPPVEAHELVTQVDQGAADAATVVKDEVIISSQTATIAGQSQIIDNDKVVLAKQIDTDTKVLKAAKAVSRKSKFKWFLIGVVTGFTAREIIKP